MQGLVKSAISFLVQSHQELQKKESSKEIYLEEPVLNGAIHEAYTLK